MCPPVLFLLIQVWHNVQKAANEGVRRCWGRGALDRHLSSKDSAASLCVSQLLLHLHILLPQQGQMLLQLGHLLCATLISCRQRTNKYAWIQKPVLFYLLMNEMECEKRHYTVLSKHRIVSFAVFQSNDWMIWLCKRTQCCGLWLHSEVICCCRTFILQKKKRSEKYQVARTNVLPFGVTFSIAPDVETLNHDSAKSTKFHWGPFPSFKALNYL